MSAAYDRLVEALRANNRNVIERGNGCAQAQCPEHDDAAPSLRVTAIEGRVLLYCHAGCQTTDVVAALNMSMADLFDNRRDRDYHYPGGRIVSKYYPRGSNKKQMPQKGNKADTSLYGSEHIKPTTKVILVVEGEEKVDAARKIGLIAVSSAMGAGKADKADWSPVYGYPTMVIADKDKAGRDHAAQVCSILDGHVPALRLFEAAQGCHDLTNHVAAGHTLDELVPISLNGQEPHDPEPPDPPPDDESRRKSRKKEPTEEPRREITWRTAAQIIDRCPEWAWNYDGAGRLMRDTLILFAGRPDAGKSTAARYFGAGYTRGAIPGCFDGQPQNVAYIASEESLEVMVKPSLRAHDADMDRIYFPEVKVGELQVRLLSTVDEAALTAFLLHQNITVVIVDPVMSAISSATDIFRNNETREYLEPWARIAEAINGLVIGIVHLIKAPGGDIVAAINGSSAFGEVARAVIAFAKDPESEGVRVLSQEKNNAGRSDLALVYRIESTTVTTDDGQQTPVGQFSIIGPSGRSVGDLLRADTAHSRLGKNCSEVLEAVRQAGEPCDPAMVAALVPGLSSDDAGKYLRRLAKNELLVKVGRGMYDHPSRRSSP